MQRLCKNRLEKILSGDYDVSLYIHIPFCHKKCFYCSFFSVDNMEIEVKNEYSRKILTQLQWLNALGIEKRMSTVYIGGGSPGALGAKTLIKIVEKIDNYFPALEEFTIELNPCDLSENFLLELNRFPTLSRLSIGVQTFNNRLLKILGRTSWESGRTKLLLGIKNFWNRSLSLDFLTGIPEQTKKDIIDDSNIIKAIHPDHLSVYQLTFEHGTPLKKIRRKKSNIPQWSDDYLDNLALFTEKTVIDHGYKKYEISNFALSDEYFCKHNIRYWNFRPYFGIGPAAVSTLPDDLFTGKPLRIEFPKSLDPWIGKTPVVSANIENLTYQQTITEYLIMNLRTIFGIQKIDFFHTFGISFSELFSEQVSPLIDEGYLVQNESTVRATEKGLLFLNTLLIRLLNNYKQPETSLLSWPSSGKISKS